MVMRTRFHFNDNGDTLSATMDIDLPEATSDDGPILGFSDLDFSLNATSANPRFF